MFDWMRVLASRIRARFSLGRLDREFGDEVESHLNLLTEENVQRGLPPEEARRAARVRLGGLTQLRETHRDLRGLPWVETLAQDIRYALRTLRKNPGFTAVAIVTLALGVGANTAIFTVIEAVLLRPLEYSKPRELVTWRGNESQMDIDDIRAQSRLFSAGGGVNPEVMDYTGGAEPLGVRAGYVDAGLFQALGVPAMLGRTISPEEDRRGGPRAVVLAYPFWREHFSAGPNILGKTIPLSGNRYTVIGVMPATFAVPEYALEVFVSLRVAYPEAAAYRGVHFMRSYWRLKPGATLAQAGAEMAAIDARLAAAYPADDKDRRTVLVPLQQWVTGDIRPALRVLFGAVCVVLLIACANFASLLMARTAARRREMLIRAALGGGRSRLIRQALTESTLLAVLGGFAGLLLAGLATRLLVAAKPAALQHLNQVSMDPVVLAFGLVVSTLTGLIFGLAPAWSLSRAGVAGNLKQHGRNAAAGPTGHNFRKLLVVSEMAMALVLLAGSGLLIKGFARLRAVEPGFNPAHVISIDMQLPANRYAETTKQTQFRRELLDRLNALPGIQAAMVGDAPLNGSEVGHRLAFEGRPAASTGDEPEVDTFCVMGDYFRVMQVPLRAGRTLTDADREDQPLAVVVNQALVRQYFAGRNPIGQRIRYARETGPPRWMTIVGVAGDIKQYSLAQPALPAIFTPFAQSNENWRRWMSVVLRTPDASAGLIPAAKREIWALDSQIPLNRIRSMDDLLRASLAERRFNMFLLSLFAGLATTLAAVGLYGVMSYSVSQRTQEIGIRIAIGAGRGDVLQFVMRQGARLAAFGLAAGILSALALTRLMTSLLFAVTPNDPATLATVVVLMTAVVLAACWVPARRAMKVDPMVALRYE
ncbi:MAG TPA: ABC transporter permease [Bryobacteraceae bacterium]|nr:ABC transporter permease [Bryobacteraceae bacterium]